jgi:membrane complex biogenesis BtpA family protein
MRNSAALDEIGPLIGMVHLLPLPGAPRFQQLDEVESRALADASALASGGANAIIVENLGDAPYFPGRVPAITVAAMTRIALRLRDRIDLPLGINVLRNDGESALAVAAASGADFVRINVLVGARVADQGLLQGRAHQVQRLRRQLDAEAISVMADVDVKHSAPLGAMSVEQEVADTLQRAGADAVIVSGHGTGGAIDLDTLRRVRATAGSARVLAGSGVSEETVGALAEWADAFIVGTSLKRNGRLDAPVDAERVRRLADAIAATSARH